MSFDALVEPTVVVVGEGVGLDAHYPPGVRVLRVPAGNVDDIEPAPIALVVLDARTHSPRDLARVRRSEALAQVPALLVTAEDEGSALDVVGADDVAVAPFGPRLTNRLRTLIDLGRTRFTLWFAQQALEHSVSGLTIGDRAKPGAPLVYATSAFEKITGYAFDEVCGSNCRFLQGAGTDPDARAALGAAIRDQQRAQVTLINYRKDGTPFWNQVTVFPVRTPDGRPLRWVGAVQNDVTSLVEARAEVDRMVALLLQRQTFDQAILDGVDVGIVTTDVHGRVTFVNRCAREVLRFKGDLDGLEVRALLALPTAAESLLARRSGRRWIHTLRAGDQDIEIDLAVSRADEASQEHLGFFFIFHDHTHEKQLEMERRRFERLAAMGTMVAGFAHEIRNPMASLRSIAESLNEELSEVSVSLPHVGRMLQVLERVERLVRTSLLFGRPSPPRRATCRPWTILSAAVSSLVPRTGSMAGELAVEAEAELPDVFVDDTQIVQVLVILLNNALDATGSPRRVLLRAYTDRGAGDRRARKSEPPPSFVRFDVSDDGPGIKADIIGRIFDPFFTTKAAGTGLGLSIAQQLVTENGGRIEVTSLAGGTTTFTVVVPVSGVEGAPVSASGGAGDERQGVPGPARSSPP